MIPALLITAFLGFFIGAATQPGPFALASLVGAVGVGMAIAGWWLEREGYPS